MLGRDAIEIAEPQIALESALEGIRLAPYLERTHRRLMRAYAANGNRAKAVATYHEFRELLAYDVGTDPEPETEVLYLYLKILN